MENILTKITETEATVITDTHLETFLTHLKSAGRAPATISQYSRTVRSLQSWLSGRPLTPELLLETLCALGIRVSELACITVEALQQKKAVISLKEKIRTILISNSLALKLRDYVRKNRITSGAVFVTPATGIFILASCFRICYTVVITGNQHLTDKSVGVRMI